MREEEAFQQRKRQAALAEMAASEKMALDRQLAEAKLRGKVQSGSVPAALQLANAYLDARKTGDIERANAIEAFAKSRDKNVQLVEGGGYVPLQGLPQALGQLKYAQQAATEQAKTEFEPERKGLVETAKKEAETGYGLREKEAVLPQLEDTVNKLSELGKKATYTYAGQAKDITRRQLGLPASEGSVARAEYISLVDNQILPLLRQTFGAQFTEREGQSLKITLGDPNKSPEEKDAVLRSFIDQKKKQIETERRVLKQEPMSKYQREEAAFNARKGKAQYRYNPQTRSLEAVQ